MLDASDITRIVEEAAARTLRGREVTRIETSTGRDWLGEPTLNIRIVLEAEPDDDDEHWYDDAARTSTVIGETMWERGDRRVPHVQFSSRVFMDLFAEAGRLELED